MVKEVFSSVYSSILLSLPENLRMLPPLIIFSILIALYGIFIWLFYRFLAQRDIIKLNLKKYNVFELAWLVKLFAIFFYVLEFIIIIPFVITFWFAILSSLLIILMKTQPLATTLLISASIIGAVRITSYFKEDLARDLAKMFPLTLISIAILTPGFFSLDQTLARFKELPGVFEYIIYFAAFILIIEVILRIFFLIYEAIVSDSPNTDAVAVPVQPKQLQ
jgi:hypothetical protein